MRNKLILLLLCTTLLGWGKKIESPKDFTAIFEGCYIELNWSKVKNADSYEIHRRIDKGDFAYLANTKDTYYIDSDCNKSGMYAYKVSAITSKGHKSQFAASNLVELKMDDSAQSISEYEPVEGVLAINWEKKEREPRFVITDSENISFGKPNIYVYPTQASQIQFKLKFPQGGKLYKSDPQYNTGWDVLINPDSTFKAEGREHSFLFYESDHPPIFSSDKGYIVKREELEMFFRGNMADIGFVGKEIEDFIEFWIPLLKDKPYYEIKLILNEELDNIVAFDISQKPDTVIRLAYMIRGLDNKETNTLKEPKIIKRERKGFVVTEWGVVMHGIKLK